MERNKALDELKRKRENMKTIIGTVLAMQVVRTADVLKQMPQKFGLNKLQ